LYVRGSAAIPGIVAFAIGAALGATELLSRYKDSPRETLRSGSGLLYMAVNGSAAALAYWLIQVFGLTFGTDESVRRPIIQTTVAGLGAMAFFRSGVFNVRIGSNDVSVGPNLILESFLQAVDRHHDRRMAAPRSKLAASIMEGVSFERARLALPEHCLHLMQNVSADEQDALGETIKGIEDDTLSDRAKAINLGLTLLNLVGKEVLQQAVDTLGHSIKGVPGLDIELLAALAKADPVQVVEQLEQVCVALNAGEAVSSLQVKIDQIKALSVPDNRKATLAARLLVNHYGEGIVTPALASIAEVSPDQQVDSPKEASESLPNYAAASAAKRSTSRSRRSKSIE